LLEPYLAAPFPNSFSQGLILSSRAPSSRAPPALA
jgi:hypothetical protein